MIYAVNKHWSVIVFEGAEIITLFAPEAKCVLADSYVKNLPVDSTTYLLQLSCQFILEISDSDETLIFDPFTIMCYFLA